jgi:brefeldin A-inhibited guanine nucleotide-exchange protein
MDFFSSLCQMALNDSNKDTTYKTLILQKVVECAEFNLSRIPIEWLRIWIIIRKAFVTLITSNANEDFALCQIALDSLKQLAIKF